MSNDFTEREIDQSEKLVVRNQRSQKVEKVIFPHSTQVGLEDTRYQANLIVRGTVSVGEVDSTPTRPRDGSGGIFYVKSDGKPYFRSHRQAEVDLLSGSIVPEDIHGRTTITSVDSSNDYILIWDATDSTLKKVAPTHLGAGGGGGAISSVANGSNNRIATFSSANALNGEANLTFDGSTLSVSGDIEVAEYIKHAGDTNTFIQFADDAIGITAGGEQLITVSEAGQDIVKIGDGGDVDFQVRTLNNDNTIYVQGDTDRVGIGTNSPSYVVDVQASSANLRVKSLGAAAYMLIDAATDNDAILYFRENGSNKWLIGHDATDDLFKFDNNNSFASPAMTISTTGVVTATEFVGSFTGGASLVALADTETDAEHYITYAAGASGNQALKTDGGLKYNPSSNLLTVWTTANSGDFTPLRLYNKNSNAAAKVSARFDLSDTSNNTVQSGKIIVSKDQEFTSTNTTQDATMTFQLVQNGTLGNKATLNSAGQFSCVTLSSLETNTTTLNVAGDLTMSQDQKIVFDSTDTFIGANTDNPEDLLIHADQDLLLQPDNDIAIFTGGTQYGTFDGSNFRLRMFRETNSTVFPLQLVNKEDAGTSAGIGMQFRLENTSGTEKTAGQLSVAKSAAWNTSANTDADMKFSVVHDDTLQERMKLTSAGDLQVNGVIANKHSTSNKISLGYTTRFYQDGQELLTLIDRDESDWEVVVNEGSTSSIDFRVESNTSEHMLFVDASTNRVGIGKSNPATALDVSGTVTATAFSGPSSHVTLADSETDADHYITYAAGASGTQALKTDGGLKYNPSSNMLTVWTTGNAGDYIPLRLYNKNANAAAEVSARFDLSDTSNNTVQAGKIKVTKDQEFTSTVGTQDASMTFQLVANGNLIDRATLSSAGNFSCTSLSAATTSTTFLNVASSIHHTGNTLTKMSFTTDQIDFYAGNVKMLTLEEDTQDVVVINESAADVDFRVETSGNTHMIFTEASTDRVGIGTDSPTTTLTVNGDQTMVNQSKIIFDTSDTFIGANADDPEDLDIAANEDIRLMPDDDIWIYTGGTDYVRFDGGIRQQTLYRNTDAEYEALRLKNQSNSADTNGSVSMLWDLQTTGNSNVQSGKIKVSKEQSFTNTSSTQDSKMSFFTALNGTLTEHMTISSDGVVTAPTVTATTALRTDGYVLAQKSGGGPAQIMLRNNTDEHTAGGAESEILFRDHANNNLAKIVGAHHNSSDDALGKLLFYTHAADAGSDHEQLSMVLEPDSGGQLGLGTESPAARLHVVAADAAQSTGVIIDSDGEDSGDDTALRIRAKQPMTNMTNAHTVFVVNGVGRTAIGGPWGTANPGASGGSPTGAMLNIKQANDGANNEPGDALRIYEDAGEQFWQIGLDPDDAGDSGTVKAELGIRYGDSGGLESGGGYLHAGQNVAQITFTGQHRNAVRDGESIDDYSNRVGLIVVASGGYYNLPVKEGTSFSASSKPTINESLPKITLSSTRNQKSVFGVVSDAEDTSSDGTYRNHTIGVWGTKFPKPENDQRLIINSLGEGAIWVCDINGSLENGDYVTSCEIPGYGMKQDDDLLHNYTVAKITQDCDFDLNATEYDVIEFDHEGQTYRKAFVGCTYHCG